MERAGFSRKEILIESLHFCIEKKGLKLLAWVIMTDHVHLIISAQDGFELAAIVRDLKKYTSRMIIAAIEENIQECRKECLPVQAGMIWMFKRAGARNTNNKSFSFGNRTIIR
jgi:putative transposase